MLEIKVELIQLSLTIRICSLLCKFHLPKNARSITMGEYESLSPEELKLSKTKITSEINHLYYKTSDNIGTLKKEELTDPVDEANSNIQSFA